MAEFDMDAYLRRRPFNPNGTDKLLGLEEATQTKIKALQQYSQERQALKQKEDAVFKKSVVGILEDTVGLDRDGVTADAVNKAVILGNSLSRASGYVGSGIWDLIGSAQNMHISDEVKAARGRQIAGNALLLELSRRLDAFPGRSDLDQDARRIDTGFAVDGDQPLGALDRASRIERQPGIHFG